eukprot:1054658-Rhodomonas_salina.1
MCGTELAYGARECAVLSSRYGARGCAVLSSRMALPGWCTRGICSGSAPCADSVCFRRVCGTDLAYGATRCVVLRSQCAAQLLHPADVRYHVAMPLRARYAMSGTDLLYAATRALCDVRYYAHAMRCP